MVGVHHAPPNSGGGSDDEKQLFTNELCECVWIVGGHGVESTVSKRRMQTTWSSLVVFPPGPLASSFRACCPAGHSRCPGASERVPHTGTCVSESSVSLLGHNVGCMPLG